MLEGQYLRGLVCSNDFRFGLFLSVSPFISPQLVLLDSPLCARPLSRVRCPSRQHQISQSQVIDAINTPIVYTDSTLPLINSSVHSCTVLQIALRSTYRYWEIAEGCGMNDIFCFKIVLGAALVAKSIGYKDVGDFNSIAHESNATGITAAICIRQHWHLQRRHLSLYREKIHVLLKLLQLQFVFDSIGIYSAGTSFHLAKRSTCF